MARVGPQRHWEIYIYVCIYYIYIYIYVYENILMTQSELGVNLTVNERKFSRVINLVSFEFNFRLPVVYVGENNGKLPPRTCPGCSVPEPYLSHDWALVPANPASKAEY